MAKHRGRTRSGTAAERVVVAPPRRSAMPPPAPRWGIPDDGDPAEFTEPAELVDRHALDVLDLSDRFELPRAESIAEIADGDVIEQLVAEHEAMRRLGVAIF